MSGRGSSGDRRTRAGGSRGGSNDRRRGANSSSGGRGNTRHRTPHFGETPSGTTRGRDRVFGRRPENTALEHSNLVRLFERQKQLNAALRRQARLLKVDVAEVRSTEVELLRRVNQAILDPLSRNLGIENPRSSRELIDSQVLNERMISEAGKRKIGGEPIQRKPISPTPLRKRGRKILPKVQAKPDRWAPLEDLFSLRGPLLRNYSRAVERGYSGGPQRWLRGSHAAKLITALRGKGFALPEPGKMDCFNPLSPLRYVVTSHVPIKQHNRRRGFHGERLRSEDTNVVVLRRQAASVPRLKLSDWPSSKLGRSWPSFPTLNESWEMFLRGKAPPPKQLLEEQAKLAPSKRPVRQLPAGSPTRTVSKMVLGIRADIKVPKSYLGYFAYRWGFLILIRERALPLNLIRWLIKQWKEDITRMFLVVPMRYNEALRRLPPSSHYSMVGFTLGAPTHDKSKLLTSCRVPTSTCNCRVHGRCPPTGETRRRTSKRRREALRETRARTAREESSRAWSTSTSDKSDSGVRLR